MPDQVAQETMPEYRLFEERLEVGLLEALAYLNSRTRHRYTGVYRFDPPMLRNVALFDRENPRLRTGCDVPMDETYCSIVGKRSAPYGTEDAEHDEELVLHPARLSVLSYYGVPLLAVDGRCIGTLCHFDDRPRLIPYGELPLLREAARAVAALVLPRGGLS